MSIRGFSMARSNVLILLIGVMVVFLPQACDFSPTSPFEGFDGKGSRLSGTFVSAGESAALTALSRSTSARSQNTFEGITVFIKQDPAIGAVVDSNGTFVLIGLPGGTITVVFKRDDTVIGRLSFHRVLANQEIRVVVTLNDTGRVELVEAQRDGATITISGCARGAGFWCQNQDGKNPNLPADEFTLLAEEAAKLLVDTAKTLGVSFPQLDGGDIADAVCNTGDQLLRQLATLALNLTAGLVEDEEAAMEALEEAILVASDMSSTRNERNEIKDVLEEINECEEDDESEDQDDVPTNCPVDDKGKITICHKEKNTITISPNAWPAHQAHGDSCGPCPAGSK
jgi:hypothetical protein